MSGGDGFDFSRFTDGASSDAASGQFGTRTEQSGSGAQGSDARRSGGLIHSSVKAPVGWLVAGLVLTALGATSAFIAGGRPVYSIVAWAACGPLAILAFAMFVLNDTRARANLLYSSPAMVRWSYRIGLGLALLGVVFSAYQIAIWVGRR